MEPCGSLIGVVDAHLAQIRSQVQPPTRYRVSLGAIALSNFQKSKHLFGLLMRILSRFLPYDEK